MRKLNFLLAAFLLSVAINAQNSELIGWDTHDLSNYGPSPYAPTTLSDKLDATGLTRASGFGTLNTAAGRAWGGTITGNDGATNADDAVANNTYFTFTVTPIEGYKAALSTLNMDYRRSASGAQQGTLQYQINSGEFTDIADLDFSVSASSGGSLDQIDLSSIAPLQEIHSDQTITFRVVLFGGTATGNSAGTWYVYDKANNSDSDFYFMGSVEEDVVTPPADGCLSGGQYPPNTFEPNCTGAPETISNAAYTGEYSLVQVTGGTEYTFSSSITTDFITIGNEDGTVALASGTGTLTWTADADQIIRFYLHLDADCNSGTGSRIKSIQCSLDVPEPGEGCLNGDDQFPSDTFVPSCIGMPETITTVGWTGEYSMVQLTAGTEYTFSSSVATDFITIGNEEGTLAFASGTGSVTWTADADQLVRFYLHLDANCSSSDENRSRIVQCGEVPPPPANDNCGDITPVELTNGVSVTFNGTTLGGTASQSELDLFGYGAVWHAVTLTGDCNNLTVDFCGTNWENMANAFIAYTDSCDATEFETGFYDDTTCDDGNFTIRFFELPAGTYYIPVIVDSAYNVLGEYTMNVISEDCPPLPVNCEDFSVTAEELEGSLFFGTETEQHIATDIPLSDVGFTLYGMEPTTEGQATSFDFIIYDDNDGLPGTLLETRTGTIVHEEAAGEILGHEFYKYTVAFDSPFDMQANTTYWIEILSDALGWQATFVPGSELGEKAAFYNVNTGEGNWASTVDYEVIFNLICEELNANDVNSFDFNYHPNPVKDVLNISSKKSVENVSVFNLAGQKVLNNAKVSNNQVDVSALTPGTYVFKVTLEGGQIETFKIIKK